MNRLISILVQSAILGSLLGCIPQSPGPATPALSAAPTPCVGQALTLGEITDDPQEVINDDGPLTLYLAGRLAPFGIACVKVKVARTVEEMIKYIKDGQVDMYFDSLFPATLVSDATGAQPILRRWRNCDPDYHSVIFTKNGGEITHLEDLAGHMIAMDRPDSTSGFVMPASYLLDHGLSLVVKETFDKPVAQNEVGVSFTYDDDNTHALVLAGKVGAGATDDYYFGQWEGSAPGQLLKLAETGSTLRQVVLLRAGLASDLQAVIKDELLKADANQDGLAAMDATDHTCKFDDTPVEIQAAFSEMRKMYEQIRLIPGWPEAYQKGQ